MKHEVAWVTFTAFWTGGVLSAGAPFMALFSLPFWNAGYTMVSLGCHRHLASDELQLGFEIIKSLYDM